MFHSILIPLDGSSIAESALDALHELVMDRSSTDVLLMKVVNAPASAVPYYAPGGATTTVAPLLDRVVEATRATAAEYLHRVRRDLLLAGFGRVDTLVASGPPAQRIAEVAERYPLVIMATRGRSGLTRLLHGSVTDYVVRSTPWSAVLVVCPDPLIDREARASGAVGSA